jgi:hypothetical protein
MRSKMLLLLFVTISCSVQQKELVQNPDSVLDLKTKGDIIEDFKKYDGPHLSPQDSCMTSYYLTKEFNQLHTSAFQTFEGIRIYSERYSISDFSFSILTNNENSKLYYYGLPDIYNLKHNDKLERGKLIKFENNSIAQLVNNLQLVDSTLDKNEINQKIRALIYYVYHEERDDMNTPALLERNFFSVVLREYPEAIDSILMKTEFLNTEDSDFIIFENEILGLVVFKISHTGNLVVIDEYLIPSKVKTKFFSKSDTMDDSWRPCQSLSYEINR